MHGRNIRGDSGNFGCSRCKRESDRVFVSLQSNVCVSSSYTLNIIVHCWAISVDDESNGAA